MRDSISGRVAIDMSDTRYSYLVHAEVQGAGSFFEKKREALAGNPVGRRLNRMERVALSYRGKVIRRMPNGLFASFGSANAAVLCACEMQRRCALLPPISKAGLGLRIGIHYGPVRQRAADAPGPTEEMTPRLLARLADGGIALSEPVVGALSAELQQLAGPGLGISGDVSAHAFDWRKGVLFSESSAGAAWASTGRQTSAGAFLVLRLDGKEFGFGIDHPIITLGRGRDNDIVIADKNASRKHCGIVQQLNGYVLVDLSTNGTYVAPDAGPAFMLRLDMATLHGSGRIACGRPHDDSVRNVLEFSVFAD